MEKGKADKLLLEITTKGAIQTVSEELGRNSLDEKVINDIRIATQSTIKDLSKTLDNIEISGTVGDDAVSHLLAERITMMKEALDIKTFEVKIDRIKKIATFERCCKGMYPPIHLTSEANIRDVIRLQKASIVLEAILFVLETAGISVPEDEETIKKVINFLKDDGDILENIEQIITNRDNPSLITSIIVFVCDFFSSGRTFWKMARLLFSEMSKYDMALNFAKITGYIVWMSAKAGYDQIAKLCSKLVTVSKFVQKFSNIETLNNMSS